ncbi:ImmA/IrrE family metallo-endopeptidase [Mesobacillus jeotgali]|uniref:ImmA/IrrE family metallo-endopeptidase n=1 Tax=Mesobacillus jeotgali TaxID=129985 RepID=UPI00178109F8|nr:ImmA/IrrE family metallo-endopeptidase [Mesobacillus jeotgali]UYZ22024.1 ImmA/IrrE family metallo-endopeptidase [Mesobacillus jeotgali]
MSQSWIIKCKKQASDIRKEFGISPFSSIDIREILRDSGINLIIEPVESDISGFFLRNGQNEIVFINSAKSKGHQSFTGAHELYHIRFDTELNGRACKVGQFDERSPSEFKADMFAANLLAPDEAVLFQINRMESNITNLNINDVIELGQHFNISHHAMLNRLKQMQILSNHRAQELKPGVIKQALKIGKDISLYLPTNEKKIISDYAEKALVALEKGLISDAKYEELLLEAGLADVLFGDFDMIEEENE